MTLQISQLRFCQPSDTKIRSCCSCMCLLQCLSNARVHAPRYEDQLQEQRRKLAELSQQSGASGGASREQRQRLEDELHKARQVRAQASATLSHAHYNCTDVLQISGSRHVHY